MVIFCLILSADDSRITHLDSAGTLGAPKRMGRVGPFFYLEAVYTHHRQRQGDSLPGLFHDFSLDFSFLSNCFLLLLVYLSWLLCVFVAAHGLSVLVVHGLSSCSTLA